jgi:hypothetical protein
MAPDGRKPCARLAAATLGPVLPRRALHAASHASSGFAAARAARLLQSRAVSRARRCELIPSCESTSVVVLHGKGKPGSLTPRLPPTLHLRRRRGRAGRFGPESAAPAWLVGPPATPGPAARASRMARWPWFWAAAAQTMVHPGPSAVHHITRREIHMPTNHRACGWARACASSATADATLIAGIAHSSVWGRRPRRRRHSTADIGGPEDPG